MKKTYGHSQGSGTGRIIYESPSFEDADRFAEQYYEGMKDYVEDLGVVVADWGIPAWHFWVTDRCSVYRTDGSTREGKEEK